MKGEKMAEALILVTTDVGVMEDVYETVREMKEIQKAAMITGPYDIMAIARADDVKEISKITVTEIRNIDGVKDTITNVVIG